MPDQSDRDATHSRIPFAYTVTRGVEVDDVWPTLAAAVIAASERSKMPTGHISIHAWFPDGTSEEVPPEALCSPDRTSWITEDRAENLQRELYGLRTLREQVSDLLRANENADYWEKLVLRYAEALLAEVDEQLRGIPVAGLSPMSPDDYLNLPDTIEMVDGIPTPKHWELRQEGRHRLGWATQRHEWDDLRSLSYEEVKQEIDRRRAELRSRPFVPSQIPFPSGPPED